MGSMRQNQHSPMRSVSLGRSGNIKGDSEQGVRMEGESGQKS